MTARRWPFNTGDFLKEVTALAGLTVFTSSKIKKDIYHPPTNMAIKQK